jgi:hypothetical protein
MMDAELEAEGRDMLAEEQELEEPEGRLHAVPHDMTSHRAHRERLKAHQERLRRVPPRTHRRFAIHSGCHRD